jgi:mRNA interferase RelE/StbE
MAWKVKLFSEAQKDFEQLDGSVRKMVLKQLVKLETDPFYGDVLGNKAGFDLTGYFKLYADNKRIRIVYRIVAFDIEVIAIDKREDMEVYKIAFKRIQSME